MGQKSQLKSTYFGLGSGRISRSGQLLSVLLLGNDTRYFVATWSSLWVYKFIIGLGEGFDNNILIALDFMISNLTKMDG